MNFEGWFVYFFWWGKSDWLALLVFCSLIHRYLVLSAPNRELSFNKMIFLRTQIANAFWSSINIILNLLNVFSVCSKIWNIIICWSSIILFGYCMKTATHVHDISISARSILVVVDSLWWKLTSYGCWRQIWSSSTHLTVSNVLSLRCVK